MKDSINTGRGSNRISVLPSYCFSLAGGLEVTVGPAAHPSSAASTWDLFLLSLPHFLDRAAIEANDCCANVGVLQFAQRSLRRQGFRANELPLFSETCENE